VLIAGRDVHEPMAMRKFFVSESELLGTEQDRDGSGGESFADEPSSSFEAVEGVFEDAVAPGRGADDEGTVLHGGGYTMILFTASEHGGSIHRGAGLQICDVVRVHETKMGKPEIAHGASGGPDVERVPGRNQHYAEKFAICWHEECLRAILSILLPGERIPA
jgi:hypothetical protein